MTPQPSKIEILFFTAIFVIGGVLFSYFRRRRIDCERKKLLEAPAPAPLKRYVAPPRSVTADAPTAVLLVSGYTQAGLAMLEELSRTLVDYYKNVVFLSLVKPGTMLSGDSKEIDRFRESLLDPLENYVPTAHAIGLHAEVRCSIGLFEFGPICREILSAYPGACFVLARTPIPGGQTMVSTLSEELTLKVRSDFVRDRIPFIEVAVSLPAGCPNKESVKESRPITPTQKNLPRNEAEPGSRKSSE